MMTPTLFSVSYAGLWGQHALDLHGFIRKAAALGYPAVELMGKRPHLSILDTDEAELARIRQTAEDCGVEIATIAGYTNFTAGKAHTEVPLGEVQVAYVRELARIRGTTNAAGTLDVQFPIPLDAKAQLSTTITARTRFAEDRLKNNLQVFIKDIE